MQFAFAVVGAAAVQRGPLWWAAHHRNHHRHADTPADVHSPVQHGFLHSHMGWFLSRAGFRTDWSKIPDLMKYPELRLLDRFDLLVPVALAVGLFFWGRWLGHAHPELGTDGPQLLVWGFFVSTIVLFHVTVTINSLAHRFGSRRFATRDNALKPRISAYFDGERMRLIRVRRAAGPENDAVMRGIARGHALRIKFARFAPGHARSAGAALHSQRRAHGGGKRRELSSCLSHRALSRPRFIARAGCVSVNVTCGRYSSSSGSAVVSLRCSRMIALSKWAIASSRSHSSRRIGSSRSTISRIRFSIVARSSSENGSSRAKS